MPKSHARSQKRVEQADIPSPDVHYTVIVRLPFPRNGFIDPPPVDWNAGKEQTLWRILSQTSHGNDIEWDTLAEEFEVTLPFLLQQAAWLYERQLSQVRAQMRKVGHPQLVAATQGSPSGSPEPSSASQPMRRAGSGGASTTTASRVPSALSFRSRDSPLQKGEGSIDASVRNLVAPGLSRTSSANTIRHAVVPSPRTDRPNRVSFSHSQRPRSGSYLRPEEASTKRLPSHEDKQHSSPEDDLEDADDSSSESSSSSSETNLTCRSQFLRRAPSLRKQKRTHIGDGSSDSNDDDDDDAPAFLPFSNTGQEQDPGVNNQPQPDNSISRGPEPLSPVTTHSTHSSTSSDAALPPPDQRRPFSLARALSSAGAPVSPRFSPTGGPTSPRRSRAPGNGPRREGSEGTPSLGGGTPSTMGSSFSDLDDASVTQSALQEALASNLQRGGASRLSLLGASLARR